MTIQYRRDKKNPDVWLTFRPASELRPGVVTVSTKSKGTRRETVLTVPNPFKVDGVNHGYGRGQGRERAAPVMLCGR